MPEVWFTGDTHFGHESMITRRWRPQYASVAEMDADILERWNAVVRPNDIVWHVGDFGMGGAARYLPLVRKLHGTVHLVTGNHDAPWPGHRDAHKHQAAWMAAGFASVQAFAKRRVAGRSVLLSHLPYDGDHTEEERFNTYRLRDTGHWLVCGHVHGAWAQRGRQINVGVDVRDFRPVPLADIAEIITVGTGEGGTGEGGAGESDARPDHPNDGGRFSRWDARPSRASGSPKP